MQPSTNSINPEHKLTYEGLRISDTELYDAMGYGSTHPDDNVLNELQRLTRVIACRAVPRFCYVIVDGTLSLTDNTLTIGTTTLHVGAIIARQLRGSRRFALFTATAGMEFEHLQRELETEGDMVKCYLTDCVGSVMAEKAADRMEDALQSEIDALGWRHTNRFSPGYCGWHVREQPALFALFPASAPCGISLTDSCLMIPIKSVSGVIGLGPDVRHLDYSCGLCSYEQCYKRKRKPART